MDADSAAPADPETLKHSHSHYWKTTKKGRIIENWVLAKDSDGKTARKVDLVHPKTGARKRKRVRKFDKMPALVRIASGGARMERGGVKDNGAVEEDGEGEGEEKKKKKMKCVVM
ncbi:hypothetical protein V500_08974 [Pseudogymnoascus sp. VKM F-4518 (FW-2643)]|nr:hypothetical protein V500_08974 [Pseudogymnoascus sp. VKM F-4518 (FW-2643)]